MRWGTLLATLVVAVIISSAEAQRKVVQTLHDYSSNCEGGDIKTIEYTEGNTCNQKLGDGYTKPVFYKFICYNYTYTDPVTGVNETRFNSSVSINFFTDNTCMHTVATEEVYLNKCLPVEGKPTQSQKWTCEYGYAAPTSSASSFALSFTCILLTILAIGGVHFGG